MTAVGKILVFLNLVFSLVVGGFVVFAYVARTRMGGPVQRSRHQADGRRCQRQDPSKAKR